MKVLVAVKRVVDFNVKIRVKSDGTGVDIAKPPQRSAGIKVPDVATLVSKLKNDAKVI